MNLVVLSAGAVFFAAVRWAGWYHFASKANSLKFIVTSALAAGNVFVFGRDLWLHQKNTIMLGLALGLFAVGGALFAWSVKASKGAALKFMFDRDSPRSILQSGPYRYIRHPFYTSYILEWLACAVATQHPVNVAYLFFLVLTLTMAALKEEKGFRKSPRAADYALYRQKAGMFWPKF